MAETRKFTKEQREAYNLAKKQKAQDKAEGEVKKTYRKPYKKKEYVHKVDFSETTQAPVAKAPVAENIVKRLFKWLFN